MLLLNHAAKMRQQREGANGQTSQITPTEAKYTMLVLLMLFLLEIVIAVWAIVMAIRCGKRHGYTLVHVVLALLFPILYLIYGWVDGCGRK
jgi:cytochrome bd-type quinol oxidase subunit 1